MKLPLHRSIIFWSGILVMAFIVWAWRDSQRYFSPLRIGNVVTANVGSGVMACHVRGRPPATFTRRCEVSQLAAVM